VSNKEVDHLQFQLRQYRKALQALEEAIATDDGDKKSRDSLLLSFVFTFEMAWKTLKSALAVRGLIAADYGAAVLRAGFQAGLILDPVVWDALRENRNEVSHAYDLEKAIAISAFVREYAVRCFTELATRLESDD
jgi:nucleotidyltransferase substrate binding protein (TIGR01987 family)